MKSNMHLQSVIGINGLLAYLCSYMCKEQGKLREIMGKVVKESPGLNLREKLRKGGNVFLTKLEVSIHEAIKRTLSLSMRSLNVGCDFVFTGPSEKRLSVLKPQDVLQKMHPEDKNIFANEIIGKYAYCHDDLENECYADFATGYVNLNTKGIVEDHDIENFTTPFSNLIEEELSEGKIMKRTEETKNEETNSISCNQVPQSCELEDPELH